MAQDMKNAKVLAVVTANIQEVLDIAPEAIDPTLSLADHGANSVDRMEIITLSMEALGIKLPFMSFANVSNIEGLVDVLAEHLG